MTLVGKRKRLVQEIAAMGEFVRGSVVLMKRRCMRPGCRRCASGRLHPTWVLTVSSQGKTRTVYLGEARVAEARRMVGNYRRLRALVEELSELNLAVLTGRELRRKGGTNDGRGQEA